MAAPKTPQVFRVSPLRAVLLAWGFLGLLLLVLALACTFPAVISASIEQRSVTPNAAGGLSYFVDSDPGATCTHHAEVEISPSMAVSQTGGTMECVFARRSLTGTLADIAAGLMLPALQVALTFQLWKSSKLRPAACVMWSAAIVTTIGLCLFTVSLLQVRTESILQEGDRWSVVLSDSNWLDRLSEQVHGMGFGAIIGAFATLLVAFASARLHAFHHPSK